MDQPDKTITTITEAIQRIVLEELQDHIYPNGNETDVTAEQPNFYTKFIMIAPCIEFLGACYDEMDFDSTRLDHEKIVERRFNTALKKIFPKSYLPFSKSKSTYSLYRFYRCAILHQLRPGEGIALTTRKDASQSKQMHLQITVNKELILIIEDLFDDLKKAAQKVIDGYKNGSITNKKGELPFIQLSVFDKLITSLYSITNSTAWGIYHLNQYYFEINTNNTKEYYGVSAQGDISIEAQLKIQQEHFPAIIHEFIHYIHEVSTIQGIFTLNLDTLNKSIFSHHMDTDLDSSLYMGMASSKFIPKFAKSHVSMQGVLGSIDIRDDSESRPGKGVFLKLLGCDEVQEIEINTPYYDDFISDKMSFPKIKYQFYKNNIFYEDYLILGKFYLYEGIAYELDREYERLVKGLKQIDDKHASSEYTVIRDVARDIVPDISTYDFLVIASASLSQRNCGEAYVRLLKQYKEKSNNSTRELALQEIKNMYISVLDQMKDGVKGQLEEIARSSSERVVLHSAMTYMTNEFWELYQKRLKYPTFEVDFIFNNDTKSLFDFVKMCSYRFNFLPEENSKTPLLHRDILVSPVTDRAIAENLTTFQANSHYYSSHMLTPTLKLEQSNEEYTCPYFTICTLKLREQHKETCKKSPWRIYEKAGGSQGEHCWYGSAVMEFKGATKIRK